MRFGRVAKSLRGNGAPQYKKVPNKEKKKGNPLRGAGKDNKIEGIEEVARNGSGGRETETDARPDFLKSHRGWQADLSD